MPFGWMRVQDSGKSMSCQGCVQEAKQVKIHFWVLLAIDTVAITKQQEKAPQKIWFQFWGAKKAGVKSEMGQNEGKMSVFARKSGKNRSNKAPATARQRILQGQNGQNVAFSPKKLISPPVHSGRWTEIRFCPHAFQSPGMESSINWNLVQWLIISD